MKTVIFDFDGTIGNTLPVGLEIINGLADKYGYRKIKIEEVPSLQKLTVREALRKFGVSLPKALIIGRAVMKELSNNLELVKIFEGIKVAIDDLEYRGYRVGIITKNDVKIVEKILDKANIKVDFIEHDSTFFGKEKAISRALKMHNISKSEAVYIGDELRDIDAAQKAGVAIISVCWGFNSEEALVKKNDIVVEKPNEILPKVREFLG